MSTISQTGLSFPFRIGVKGGAVLSTTSVDSVEHIEESIKQILLTYEFERTMEYHCHSKIEQFIFTTMGESEQTLLKYQVCEALKQDTRISVTMDDVSTTFSEDDELLQITICFYVISLDSSFVTTVEI